jgi:uncharacterized protein YjbJ (UPF0337 family)
VVSWRGALHGVEAVLAGRSDGYTALTIQRRRSEGGDRMGAEDKVSNKIDDLGGKAKEAVGNATGDDSTKNEGKIDQAKSSLKDAGEKVKDAFKN